MFHVKQDHPRSRGVYVVCTEGNVYRIGSSPLARGLPRWRALSDNERRIIPARAGFTESVRGAVQGVAGSSPLARGLLVRIVGGVGVCGIIPARAGFTSPVVHSYPLWRDHPRSRGVYLSGNGMDALSLGSSPLARGLLASIIAAVTMGGIIPARAGFTATIASTAAQWAGSSPLARGLRKSRQAPSCHGGIIPARAGFTQPGGFTNMSSVDHPRSRGVYGRIDIERPITGRIIPARAGFTRNAVNSGTRPRDHPRSRGVYNIDTTALLFQGGSSPLARGLLEGAWGNFKATRIIPARAGFTMILRIAEQ